MSVISHWQVPTIFIAPGMTWYRKFEIRVKGKGSWWIFDSFLVSRNRVGQGRETLLFSCLLLTHLTNSGKSRNPEVFLPCFVDFSPCPLPASKPDMSPSWIVFVFSLYISYCLSGNLDIWISFRSANRTTSPYRNFIFYVQCSIKSTVFLFL